MQIIILIFFNIYFFPFLTFCNYLFKKEIQLNNEPSEYIGLL